MLNYSCKAIEKAVQGKILTQTRRRRFRGKVSLDTRTIQPGDLFIPLKGKNYDGHNFIEEAFKKGARLCLAELSLKRKIRRKDPDIIFVEDTLQALGRLGAFHRRQKKVPVIAVTGSCGKTTTKDLIAHFLSERYHVLKNEGSENNAIGVPKTLLQLDDHEVAVLELGTNQAGEIRHLTRMADPSHGVLTMIGNAHLMGFRSIQGVKREKLSLIEAADDGTVMIYNAEDRNIEHQKLRTLKTIRVGFSKRFDFFADEVHLMHNGAAFRLNARDKMKTSLLGRHNILNIMLAMAVASQMGVSPKKLKRRVQDFVSPKGRVRHQEVNGIHWIDDSYNANPSSLNAAIELFHSYPPPGRRILVLGDMLELGDRAAFFHREAARNIADHPFEMVLTVGPLCRSFAEEAIALGFTESNIKAFDSSEKAGEYLKGRLQKKDTVLLKGSRGMKMERVMEICRKTPVRLRT